MPLSAGTPGGGFFIKGGNGKGPDTIASDG